MRVAGRGYIKGFLIVDFWRRPACCGFHIACIAESQQAAAEDGGDSSGDFLQDAQDLSNLCALLSGIDPVQPPALEHNLIRASGHAETILAGSHVAQELAP